MTALNDLHSVHPRAFTAARLITRPRSVAFGWEDWGVLILAGSPIGRAADASGRLAAALRDADVIAAEDTRRLRRLAQDLEIEIRGIIVSHFEGNERQRESELIEHLHAGRTVLVITDAGMPSVSDPGYRITAAAVAEGIRVTAIPGPSAVLTALAVSGLPVDRFCFEGFAPRKTGERDRVMKSLVEEPRTMVFFESPHRTQVTLEAMAEAFGADRRAAVCRELTKTYEEVARGTLAELVDWARAKDQVRGEVTLVVAGAPPRDLVFEESELQSLVDEAEAGGASRRDAISQVAEQMGVSRKRVYAAAHRPRA